jgi:hypothetical protein
MKQKSYSTTIEVVASPQKVFDQINDIPSWWTRDFEGSNRQLGDEFVICHPGQHYSKQKLVESIPGKKIVWLVTESRLEWLEKDKEEWTNTRMIFELTPGNSKTELTFTHDGLTPDKACYSRCSEGWEMVIKEKLHHTILNSK